MSTKLISSSKHVWRNILPTGAPGCSQGTPYSFWAKSGDPTKLALIFSGGGACWKGENAALHGKPFYHPFAGLEMDPSDLGGVLHHGIYPTANGDIFLGDAVTDYDVPPMNGHPATKIKILHKGYENALCAVDWMFKTYPDPKTVAVMGWNAGALVSPLYTHIVAQNYSDASVTHFADGRGAYRVREKLAPLFKTWGTEGVLKKIKGFEDLSVDSLSLEDLYIRTAELHPDIVFHQYNEKHDAIQALFMRLIGVDSPNVSACLNEAHTYIRAKVANFRTYTSWGHDEGIIGGYYDAVFAENALDNRGRPHVLDRLYTRQTNGVRFLDWFTAAITGGPVENVTCVDSETPEYHWTHPKFPQ